MSRGRKLGSRGVKASAGFAAALILAGVFTVSKTFAVGAPAVTIVSTTRQSPVQTNLVSDIPGLAVTTDPNLIDPWGISNSATSPYWISDQGTNRATLYNGAGTITALVVGVPQVGSPSGPTGQIAVPTGTTGFNVPGTTSVAKFIFATLDGTIAAWASGNAVTAVTIPGASFTGLAFANNGTANFLYAADFVTGGGVKVFDSNFNPTVLAGSFTDPSIPAGYQPFNVQLLGSDLYVAYAEVAAPGFPTFGSGLGYVDEFDLNGNLVSSLIVAGGQLNAPWGLTMSPSTFSAFPSDLLVGNFGNGQINAFNPANGAFIGTISDPGGRPIVNDGLWAIEFGNGNAGSSPSTLYFTAGINGGADGLFGALTPGPAMLTFTNQLVAAASGNQTITIENTGSANLVLSAAPAISGTDAAEFAINSTSSTCTNGATVAPTGSCTVVVAFTPAAVGTRGPATLTIADNAANSPQTVTVSGTGVAGAPNVTLTTINPFGATQVGAKSAAQTITISNGGSAPLIFGASAVAVTNDFSETDTCSGSTVAIAGTCTVSVSFSPSSTANNPRTGTITLTDNAATSPQTIPVSGTAQDFTVTTPATTSVTHGTPGTATATIGALGGFTGSVAMTCSGSIPQGSCSVTSPVTAPGTATVTFTTAASTANLPNGMPNHVPPVSPRTLMLLLTALASLCGVPMTRRSRARFSLAAATCAFIVLAGCSSNNSTATTSPATPAGQYQLTVTGSSGGVTRSSNITLTVN
jgi:uncharacterized protein (TIGR03118 family)